MTPIQPIEVFLLGLLLTGGVVAFMATHMKKAKDK